MVVASGWRKRLMESYCVTGAVSVWDDKLLEADHGGSCTKSVDVLNATGLDG